MKNLFRQTNCTLIALIFTIAPFVHTQTFTDLYQFKSGPNGSSPWANVILDSSVNLYGTTTLDGAFAYGTVFEVTPAGKETVLYSFSGNNGDGSYPIGPLLRDTAGNLYGTTESGGIYKGPCGQVDGCGIAFKLSPNGKETVLHRFSGTNGDGTLPLQGLVQDSVGSLYGTTAEGGAFSGGTIFKIDTSGKETLLYSFNPSNGGGSYPYGGSLLRDSAGNLYGTNRDTVFKFDTSGTFTLLHHFNGQNGDGLEPSGTLIQDAAGNLYGATLFGGAFGFGTVFKIDRSNNETVLHNFSPTNGDGVAPGGELVMDHAGNLYGATNSGGALYVGTIFKLDPSGTETILHSFSGDDGNLPELGLVADSNGNLYGTTQYGGQYGGGVVFKVTP